MDDADGAHQESNGKGFWYLMRYLATFHKQLTVFTTATSMIIQRPAFVARRQKQIMHITF
jgi:hypothetical protein